MRITVLIIGLCCVFNVSAQNARQVYDQAVKDYYNFQYTRAIGGFEQAKDYYAQSGDQKKQLKSSYYLLMSHFELGNTGEALDYLFDGLDLAVEKYGEESSEVGDFYIGYGKFYHQKESYDTAKMFYRAALELKEEQKGPLIYGEIYANLGYACDYYGEYDSALIFYRKAADIFTEQVGLYHPYTDWLYASMPYVASNSGNYEAEVESAKKSLDIKVKLWGEETEDHLGALKALAVAHEHAGNAELQKQYFEECLSLTGRLKGQKSTEYATALYQVGNAYSALNQVDQAVKYNQNAYELMRKVKGDKDPETLNLLRNIGNVNYDGGRYEQALTYYQQNLDAQIKINGKNSETVIQSLSDVAQVKENLGQFDEALELYQRVLELQKKYQTSELPGTYVALARLEQNRSKFQESLDLLDDALLANLKYNDGDLGREAFIKNNIGTVYRQMEEYVKAQQFYEESLEIRIKVFGEMSAEVAQTTFNLGNLYLAIGNYTAAAQAYNQTLKIEQEYYGKDHPHVANTWVAIASLRAKQGKYQEEIDLLNKALNIEISANGEQSVGLVAIYNNLAIANSNLVRFQDALEYNRKHRDLVTQIYGEHSEKMAENYNVLATIKHDMGDLNEAFGLYEQAADIFIEIYPDGNIDLANVYNNLGVAYMDYQEYSKAQEYLEEALRIMRKSLPENHYDILTTKMNLGLVEYGKSNYQKAIELFKETIRAGMESGNLDSLSFATTYQNMSIAYKMEDQLPEALEAAQKSLTIREGILDAKSSFVADMYTNIGNMYLDMKEYDKAERAFLSAERKYQDFGVEYVGVSLAKLYLGLSELSVAKGDFIKALAYTDKSLQTNQSIEQQTASSVLQFVALVQKVDYSYLQYLNTKDQKFLQQSTDHIIQANKELILAENEITNDQDQLEFAIWKNLLTNIGVKNALANFEVSQDSKYLEEAFYYAERSKANVLVSALQESQVKKFSGIDQNLVNREQELKTTIQLMKEKIFKLSGDPDKKSEMQHLNGYLFTLNREYDQVLAALKSNSKYQRLTAGNQIVSVNQVQTQLLNPGEAIIELAASDSTLHAFLITKDAFQVFSRPYDEKFDQMVRAFRNAIMYKSDAATRYAATKLYEVSLADAEQYLIEKGITLNKLTIVPEGPFNYFPFEALERGGKYLIEDYDVQYSYSLTLSNLLKQSEDYVSNNSLLAFAPVFSDPNTSALTQGARDVFVASRAASTEDTRGFTVNGEFITPLPGTKEEVDAIDELVKSKGNTSETLVYDQAKEEVIKSGILNKYQYIHFATHGFVNEATPAYSGVFMSQDQSSQEDCILFASEIYNLNLKADLVTLSACETGLGKFAYGEGIVGLTRAFFYAGAKNLLVSQWKVSDESTARLMVDFYSNILSGKDKATALREAKLALIKDEAFSKPYFWAPFVLVGE